MPKTRGELEAEFTKAMIQLEKEYQGRGPLDARTFFIDDMVLVRMRGILTQAEKKLAQTESGSSLIKETRRQLFETSRPYLEEIVRKILDCNIVSFHSDISTTTGERIVVLIIDRKFA